jgi:cell filamentation protein
VNRYSVGAPGDEQFEPGSDKTVLRNKLGVTNLVEVGRIEASLLAVAQARSFLYIDTETSISVGLIKALHRSWLGSLYDFAGTIRTIDLAKNSVTFAPVAYMENTLAELDQLLSRLTPCQGMSEDELVQAIARVHAELLLAHPFREGNGRLARWVADLMTLQDSRPPLDWGFAEDLALQRDAYFAALRRSFAMDFKPLEDLVRAALYRADHSREDPVAEQ